MNTCICTIIQYICTVMPLIVNLLNLDHYVFEHYFHKYKYKVIEIKRQETENYIRKKYLTWFKIKTNIELHSFCLPVKKKLFASNLYNFMYTFIYIFYLYTLCK